MDICSAFLGENVEPRFAKNSTKKDKRISLPIEFLPFSLLLEYASL
jgi:hypothetical protein